MSASRSALLERHALAVDAARAAGELTLRHFRSPELRVEHKADGSPVTAADRASEALLRERIGAAFPHDAILGEEQEPKPGTSGYRWFLDPIDGTESFARGVPLYGVLVACELDGELLLGVIDCPGAGERVHAARGRGAFWSAGGGPDLPARVSRVAELREALVLCTSPAGLDRASSSGARERLLGAVRRTRGWSDCYGYLLVATGRAEAAFDPVMNAWDNAPLLPILEEAGGRFSDLRGARTIHGASGLGSNGRVHEELLGLLRG
jgi:histidinol phosphatase-like enzyme (inositol monophosphatase family)